MSTIHVNAEAIDLDDAREGDHVQLVYLPTTGMSKLDLVGTHPAVVEHRENSAVEIDAGPDRYKVLFGGGVYRHEDGQYKPIGYFGDLSRLPGDVDE